jgi:hypothetical protein
MVRLEELMEDIKIEEQPEDVEELEEFIDDFKKVKINK